MVTLEEIEKYYNEIDYFNEIDNRNHTKRFWDTVDALKLGNEEVGVTDKFNLNALLEEDDLEVWAVDDKTGKVIIYNWSTEEGGWEALDVDEWLEGVEGYIHSHEDDYSEFDKYWTRG